MKREELHKLLFETLCIIDDICKKKMSGGFWIPVQKSVHSGNRILFRGMMILTLR